MNTTPDNALHPTRQTQASPAVAGRVGLVVGRSSPMSGASPEFIEFVRELMSPLGTLSDGRFFGGHSFKSRGTQFAMIMGNTLYFCVNDHTRKDYEAKGMESFSYTTKKRRVFVRKYYAVPEDIIEEQDELVKWGTLAIDAATNA